MGNLRTANNRRKRVDAAVRAAAKAPAKESAVKVDTKSEATAA